MKAKVMGSHVLFIGNLDGECVYWGVGREGGGDSIGIHKNYQWLKIGFQEGSQK